MLFLFFLGACLAGVIGIVGLLGWINHNRSALQDYAVQKTQLQQQLQWLRTHESDFLPLINQLAITPDGLLDVTDRTVDWLGVSGPSAPDFEWGEPGLLTLAGLEGGVETEARLNLTRHRLQIKSLIADENMLLSLLDSADRLSSGATDIRSCRVQRVPESVKLELSCRLIVLSLPLESS